MVDVIKFLFAKKVVELPTVLYAVPLEYRQSSNGTNTTTCAYLFASDQYDAEDRVKKHIEACGNKYTGLTDGVSQIPVGDWADYVDSNLSMYRYVLPSQSELAQEIAKDRIYMLPGTEQDL